MLVVMAGLPGAGKTTLARAFAQQRNAVYLRIDTIEQALRSADPQIEDMGPTGYMIAYAVAEENLRLGRIVVADSVNPLKVTRDAWRDVATRTSSVLCEVEVICSDREDHRRRVETRTVDVPGLILPTWQQVLDRDYEPWDRPHLILDTALRSPSESLEEFCSWIDGQPPLPERFPQR